MTRFAILGFGLMGGSLALAARAAASAVHITAVDRADVLEIPEARDAADVLLDVADEAGVGRALAESDITFLAMPVSAICERVAFALAHAPVVTDFGSTKRRVVEFAARSPRAAQFVPGHPMAGLPDGGIRNASADLFRGRSWILCPERSDPGAVALVAEWVPRLAAQLVFMSAEEHDAAVARTSHLPQLLASALAVLAAPDTVRRAAGPAFERATRVAGGPEPMWRDIFASNGDQVALALRALWQALEPVADELAAGDSTRLADALLGQARRLRGR